MIVSHPQPSGTASSESEPNDLSRRRSAQPGCQARGATRLSYLLCNMLFHWLCNMLCNTLCDISTFFHIVCEGLARSRQVGFRQQDALRDRVGFIGKSMGNVEKCGNPGPAESGLLGRGQRRRVDQVAECVSRLPPAIRQFIATFSINLLRLRRRAVTSPERNTVRSSFRAFGQEPSGRAPDDLFTRRWALTTLEGVMETLSVEYTAEGKERLFPFLPPFLSFSGGEERYQEIAPQAGVSVSALHVTVFRFRQRYREVLRRFVGDTVRDEGDVDSELTKLLVGAS